MRVLKVHSFSEMVRQGGDFLYVVGGYGPQDFNDSSKGYVTYDHVAKIHIASMINLKVATSISIKCLTSTNKLTDPAIDFEY